MKRKRNQQMDHLKAIDRVVYAVGYATAALVRDAVACYRRSSARRPATGSELIPQSTALYWGLSDYRNGIIDGLVSDSED